MKLSNNMKLSNKLSTLFIAGLLASEAIFASKPSPSAAASASSSSGSSSSSSSSSQDSKTPDIKTSVGLTVVSAAAAATTTTTSDIEKLYAALRAPIDLHYITTLYPKLFQTFWYGQGNTYMLSKPEKEPLAPFWVIFNRAIEIGKDQKASESVQKSVYDVVDFFLSKEKQIWIGSNDSEICPVLPLKKHFKRKTVISSSWGLGKTYKLSFGYYVGSATPIQISLYYENKALISIFEKHGYNADKSNYIAWTRYETTDRYDIPIRHETVTLRVPGGSLEAIEADANLEWVDGPPTQQPKQ